MGGEQQGILEQYKEKTILVEQLLSLIITLKRVIICLMSFNVLPGFHFLPV